VRSGFVWTNGDNTELEAWIADESRVISVTRQAIEEYLRLEPEVAAVMPPGERLNFVREHLGLVMAAASRKSDPLDTEQDVVTIRSGELLDD
jgi:cobyrinic acid a,c-diamide synthase